MAKEQNPLLVEFKYYRDASGGLHAFAADGSEDAFIREDLVAVETAEIKDTLVPPFNLAQEIDRLSFEVNNLHSSYVAAWISQYPLFERESWPVQLAEAKDLIANGDTAVTPFIDALVKDRDITRQDMAAKIIEKDLEYREVVGTYTGIRQDHIKAIESINLLPTKAAKAAVEAYDIKANWPPLEDLTK